jgi:hypothetical protein
LQRSRKAGNSKVGPVFFIEIDIWPNPASSTKAFIMELSYSRSEKAEIASWDQQKSCMRNFRQRTPNFLLFLYGQDEEKLPK